MFKNNIKIAWRNLLKDRQFTLLNLIGLSTGLACILLIYLWASDELSVDRFHNKNDLLFQVMQNVREANDIQTIEATPGPLAKTMAEEMPEIAYSVPVIPSSYFSKGILSVEDAHIKANGQFVGKDYFNVFSYHLIEGSKNQVLTNKNSIVISRDLALKFFNTTANVVGKTIRWYQDDFNGLFLVSGIFENAPSNSSVQFDFLVNFEFYLEKVPELLSWGNSSPNTYLVLKEHSNIDLFNQKIAGYMKSKSGDTSRTIFIRPYADAYLFGKYENGVVSGGRIQYVELFSVIGIFILLIACINFMNLSTAAASRRLKEMAVKKTVGANRAMLVSQYLTESMLMTFLSLLFAIVMVLLILPKFNTITGKQLTLHFDLRLILSVLGITVITGILSGSYPALYLSGFNAINILKGKIKTSFAELLVRKGLVVFQFAISVIFIVAVLVVYKQMALVQSKNLGYNKDNIIYFEMGVMNEGFLAESKNIPGVVNSSYIWGDFMGGLTTTSGVSWEGKDPNEMIDFGALNIGYDFIETFGMKMAAGHSFSRKYGSDSLNVILNETAIKVMGLKNPIGKTVKIWGENLTIIGVVRDFHFQSLYNTIKPFFFKFKSVSGTGNMATIKINAREQGEVIDRIQALYRRYNPDFPFEYRFLDEDYQAQYEAETRVAVLSKYFAGLAIVISCLGLFGLAAFTAQRRLKEIGIRRVLGATEKEIIFILSKDFLKLMLIAVLIALPFAWWASNHWLNDFAYRIPLGAGIFLTAGIVTILITLLTISFQTIKAALANPLKSLKTE